MSQVSLSPKGCVVITSHNKGPPPTTFYSDEWTKISSGFDILNLNIAGMDSSKEYKWSIEEVVYRYRPSSGNMSCFGFGRRVPVTMGISLWIEIIGGQLRKDIDELMRGGYVKNKPIQDKKPTQRNIKQEPGYKLSQRLLSVMKGIDAKSRSSVSHKIDKLLDSLTYTPDQASIPKIELLLSMGNTFKVTNAIKIDPVTTGISRGKLALSSKGDMITIEGGDIQYYSICPENVLCFKN